MVLTIKDTSFQRLQESFDQMGVQLLLMTDEELVLYENNPDRSKSENSY
jgi:hypothetical protein